MRSAAMVQSKFESSGGRLVSADGRTLPLEDVALTVDARGGVARAVLTQRFVNPYEQPLAVTYLMPLPADGAVSGYAFRIGDRRIVGVVDKKKAARERFERAILEGRTAGLVDEERSSLFTQQLGNVPPKAEIHTELVIDQKLAFLPDGDWEWRFPTVIAPRYMGAEGRVTDAEKITVDVADGPLPVTASLALAIRDRLQEGARPESPSHPIQVSRLEGRSEIRFTAETGARLDRDVVVRWRAVASEVGLSLDVGTRGKSGEKYGLLTITPPDPKARPEAVARDLILLLDTSGSMSGEPLAQLKKLAAALIQSLADQDRLELIEFSNAPRRWSRKAVEATEKQRRAALEWLAELEAGGGTEMRSGLLEALSPLREDAQRQVVLITDGLIGAEHEVIRVIAEKLPGNSRVHVVGVGDGTNRSLSHPATRLGRGVELIVGIGEDPERAAKRLVARTFAPLVTELSVTGSAVEAVAPARLPDLFAGSPTLISLKLAASGGQLVVRGKMASGRFEHTLQLAANDEAPSAAAAALYAREAVEDLEVLRMGNLAPSDVDAQVEKLGIDFQISTRLTSWVAIGDVAVDPTAPTRQETVPQELARGMSISGLGLRQANMPARAQYAPASAAMAPTMTAAGGLPPPPAPKGFTEARYDQLGLSDDAFAEEEGAAAPEPEVDLGRGRPSDKKEKAKAPAPRKRLSALFQRRPEAAPASQGARRLKGKRKLFDGKLLVIEVMLDAPLTWTHLSVTVTFADGSTAGATVNPAMSTAQGAVPAGTVVRLALDLVGTGTDPVKVAFFAYGVPCEVELS